ncbi:Uncharacterized protein Fot_19564 [Forsythia ovata]|uniref:Uncharacterized protein n=1 Tax=Forsythia ovata TaxID=205694 RepID=A0ABD1VNF6_9LAMI
MSVLLPSAILDDPQKRCKRSFSNTKKVPIEEGTSALTKVDNLAKDDDCSIINVEAKSELNAHCMNEHICVTFADKDPSVTLMGVLFHRTVGKTHAKDVRALTDEKEAKKKVFVVVDARLK